MIRKKRCGKAVCAVLSLLILCAGSAAAHTAYVENSGTAAYKSVRLTPQIYQYANADLSDLMLMDDNGEPVPYFIRSCDQTVQENKTVYPMEFIDSYIKDDAFYFDYRVWPLPDSDVAADSIFFTTQNTDFAKPIAIYGSYDGIHWEYVQDDMLYAVDGNTKLSLTFHTPQKYTHYRFRLANNLERITFESVQLQHNDLLQETSRFVEQLSPAFRTEEKERQTHIYIEGLKHLKLAQLTLHTDSMFQRSVRSLGAQRELYRLTFDGTTYEDTTLPLGGRQSGEDVLEVIIDNHDDKPITISGITVRYYADDLVFAGGDSKSFTIAFSGDNTAKAPVYDIASYQAQILQAGTDRLTVGNVEIEQAQQPQTETDYTLIFNCVIVAVAVLLGILLLLKLRKKRT